MRHRTMSDKCARIPQHSVRLAQTGYAVNIGDGLARWTDGLLKSTYHRVRAPKITDNKVTCNQECC